MPANTFTTASAIGNREDLVNIIYNTSPSDTPLISAIDRVKATAVTHEWQRDQLAAASNNIVAEGSDVNFSVVQPTQRLSNQTQISRRDFSISHTQEKVDKAGRSSEIRLQAMKKGKELRTDMELACIENPVFITGTSRQTKGLRGWCATNNSLGVGGVAPIINTNTGPVDGALRNYTEPLLRSVVLTTYQNGGNPKMILLPPVHKQTMSSSFTNGATKFLEASSDTISTAYKIYASDFGDLKIVPDRQMSRTREVYLVDPDLVALAILREINDEELAKTGSARNFMVEAEYALEVREERGLGCVRDLQ